MYRSQLLYVLSVQRKHASNNKSSYQFDCPLKGTVSPKDSKQNHLTIYNKMIKVMIKVMTLYHLLQRQKAHAE